LTGNYRFQKDRVKLTLPFLLTIHCNIRLTCKIPFHRFQEVSERCCLFSLPTSPQFSDQR
jgi:hypothetical protein